jgi:hypothetical protein
MAACAREISSIMAVFSSNSNVEPLADGQSATLVAEDSGRPAIAAKMPRNPAPNVAELSARLFAAYAIDGGSIRLAGCTLEPVPIVHVRGKCGGAAGGNSAVNVVRMGPSSAPIAVSETTTELYLSASGETLDAPTIAQLGLDDLVSIDKPPRLKKAEYERLLELARQYVADAGDEQIEIIWCRYAAGKLRFSIGQEFVELPFADWAVRLAPPSYICPHSGRATFHLSAIDDGRIVAAEEIAACEESGRRVLRSELVKCGETGKLVWRELTETCSAMRQPILRERMVECPICGTRVSPQALVTNQCGLCAGPVAVAKDDPRLARILSAHPRLADWRHWKIAATPDSYVVEASGAWRRLLIVFELDSLQPRKLFERNRLQSNWCAAPHKRWPDELGSRISSRGA